MAPARDNPSASFWLLRDDPSALLWHRRARSVGSFARGGAGWRRETTRVLSDDTVVRALSPNDRSAWLELWTAYCAFYEVEIAADITETTWRRLLRDDSGMHALVAASGSTNTVFGFAHYVVHPFTWSDRPACYLEDLFVRDNMRGKGVGRALIDHLVVLARQHDWARIYWMTRESNALARRLYDTFGERDDCVRYVLDIAVRTRSGDPASNA